MVCAWVARASVMHHGLATIAASLYQALRNLEVLTAGVRTYHPGAAMQSKATMACTTCLLLRSLEDCETGATPRNACTQLPTPLTVLLLGKIQCWAQSATTLLHSGTQRPTSISCFTLALVPVTTQSQSHRFYTRRALLKALGRLQRLLRQTAATTLRLPTTQTGHSSLSATTLTLPPPTLEIGVGSGYHNGAWAIPREESLGPATGRTRTYGLTSTATSTSCTTCIAWTRTKPTTSATQVTHSAKTVTIGLLGQRNLIRGLSTLLTAHLGGIPPENGHTWCLLTRTGTFQWACLLPCRTNPSRQRAVAARRTHARSAK